MKIKFITIIFLLISSCYANEFEVKRFAGKVLVNGEKLSKEFPLQTGDSIEAIGKKSYAQITSKHGSTFLIRNGKIKLDKFDSKETLISLISGKFFHHFNNMLKKRSFKIKTKHATMGVRGTKYLIDTSKDGDYICVCEGVVAAIKDKTEQTYSVVAGDDLFIYYGKKDSHQQKATAQMFDMTAKEFKAMGYPIKED